MLTKYVLSLLLHVTFNTEFILLLKIPPFYEVNLFNRKWQAHGGISKIFLLDHFYRHLYARNNKISPIFHFDQVKQWSDLSYAVC